MVDADVEHEANICAIQWHASRVSTLTDYTSCQTLKGNIEFQVRWKGCTSDDDSWECVVDVIFLPASSSYFLFAGFQ
jgi:hypothetical protein